MIDEALRDTGAAVDRMLDALLPPASGPQARLFAAMRYAVLGGGKRLRPCLTVFTADLFGVDRVHALRAGAAVELIHAYSLVHDDLPAMDDDDLRRGQPTVHIRFDEATAILAGDTLLTLAFEVLADPQTHPDPAVRSELVRLLAVAAGGQGMAGGQMIDLMAKQADLPEADIRSLQALKTGAMLAVSCTLGAVLGQASVAEQAALDGFGHDIGAAFQIADDLLDVEGDAAAMGKAAGKDAAAGKKTLVGLWGVDRARGEAYALADRAVARLDSFGAPAETLRAVAHRVVNRQN